jgi:hypothetical protein
MSYPASLDKPTPATTAELMRKLEMETNPVTRYALREAIGARIDRAHKEALA